MYIVRNSEWKKKLGPAELCQICGLGTYLNWSESPLKFCQRSRPNQTYPSLTLIYKSLRYCGTLVAYWTDSWPSNQYVNIAISTMALAQGATWGEFFFWFTIINFWAQCIKRWAYPWWKVPTATVTLILSGQIREIFEFLSEHKHQNFTIISPYVILLVRKYFGLISNIFLAVWHLPQNCAQLCMHFNNCACNIAKYS